MKRKSLLGARESNSDKFFENLIYFPDKALPKQLTVKETSLIFNIPQWTLRSYIFRKLIPHRRLRRKIYIPTEKFLIWLSQFDVEPKKD